MKLSDINKNKDLLAKILSESKFLDDHYAAPIPLRQRLWHFDNKHYALLLCQTCNTNKVNFSEKTKVYSRFCSSKCAHTSDSVRQKTEKTCMAKYGVKSNLCLTENKEKEKETKLRKYGCEHYTQTKEFKEKYKKTCLAKYGVDNASKLDSTKEKINLTNQSRYNRKRKSQEHLTMDVIELKNNKEEMKKWYYELKMPVTEIARLLKVNHSQLCVHFNTNLGIKITRHNVSMHERQVSEFITSLGFVCEMSNRIIIKPKEVDIYIPEKKIAFEINGLAWHSELRGKTKDYHINKTRACLAKGVRLVQIWTTEWDHQQELVKSRIKSILGVNNTIPGRKCKVIEVDNMTAKEFLDKNHIQGNCPSKVRLGLESNDGRLVALMTFGKSRFTNKIEWELIRYCSEQGCNIVGGANKLFSFFKKKYVPTTIISYCDLRWNTGELYSKLGFGFARNNAPNYWYIKNYANRLESRMQYQKHKLKDKLISYDPELTEWENMIANKYDRVWDCGNSVWIWRE